MTRVRAALFNAAVTFSPLKLEVTNCPRIVRAGDSSVVELSFSSHPRKLTMSTTVHADGISVVHVFAAASLRTAVNVIGAAALIERPLLRISLIRLARVPPGAVAVAEQY